MAIVQVYSYLRFSDPKQAAGHSAERQLAYAQRWAAERGMLLDERLSLRDEGLSAYHQNHVKHGALGVFLKAIEDGKVAAGSVLIVEGLDRLSRAEPIQAQAQLAQIVNAGITVVTASDSKEYNREKLKANPMDLVYSLLVMIRAHEESETKSKRVKAAIRRQCDAWVAGTYRGVIRNGKDPSWVRWTGTEFELVQDRVNAVRAALDLFRFGYGHQRIASGLREQGLSITGNDSNPELIYRTVRNRALIGEKVMAVDGEEYRLENYYPRLVSDTEFFELQGKMGTRGMQRGRPGDIPGVITGAGVARCGYCGGVMAGQNTMRGRKLSENGAPPPGHRRLLCETHRSGNNCPVGGSCSVVHVELALMAFCADQMNLTSMLDSSDRCQPARDRLANSRRATAEIELKLERVTEAMLASSDGATPLTFIRKARELEADLAKSRAEEYAAERALVSIAQTSTPAMAEAWAALFNGVKSLNADARIMARELVRDTFERIAIYHRGFEANQDGKTIDLVLVAKGGGSRLLSIDKKTGNWKATEHFSHQ